MIRLIAIQEIKSLVREKKFWIISLLLLLLLCVSLFSSSIQVKKINQERTEAQNLSREGWLAQPPKNPHTASHFGNFAFRIQSPLSFFDNGIDTYTGSYLFLEPHKQNGDKFSQAEESSSLLRFGELTPAFILQILLPLLIIFSAFASVSSEKENQTIKILFTQGCSMRQIVTGKILGITSAFTAILVPFFALSIIALTSLTSDINEEWERLFLLIAFYIFYVFIWSTVCVTVSAWSDYSRNALMKLLGIWLIGIVIIPKAFANIGSLVYTTPSQFQFSELINKDVSEGIDGHNPQDSRRAALLEKTLKEYQVKTSDELPVNFDAIAMIEGEKYTTAAFRKRYAEILSIFNKQNKISFAASFINPVQAIQYSSMSLCGTNITDYSHFQFQAEEYRLYFVNLMNDYMAKNTQSGSWDTKFGIESYSLVKPFTYERLSLTDSILQQPLSFIALFFWAGICIILIIRTNTIKIL